MCGRYSLTIDQEALQVAMGVEGLLHPRPRFNIAPSQKVPVMVCGREGPNGRTLTWGLVPSWARDPASGFRPINARRETVAQKPTFRDAFRNRRCLVPADGFFEWRKSARVKVPFFISRPDGAPFTFAGIWERWSDGGEPLETFAILTMDAVGPLRSVHPRMPVILPDEARAAWLDHSGAGAAAEALLETTGALELELTEVSTHVNSPANDDPRCIEPSRSLDLFTDPD